MELWYLDAFWKLSTCRQVGMSMGPIPWRDMIAYAEHAGLDPDLVPLFVDVMIEMDNGYQDWHAKQRETEAKAKETEREAKRARAKGRSKLGGAL